MAAPDEAAWRPLLDGELAARAHDALDDLGHALYALERAPAIGAALFESVLSALEQLATRDGDLVTWFTPNDTIHVDKARYPRGHYNLSVGQGIAGCIGVLVKAHAASLAPA